MAATLNLNYFLKLAGLSSDETKMAGNVTLAQVPSATTGIQYRTMVAADTEEALDVGDVSTIDLIVIRAITYDLDVDTSFVAAFSAELNLVAGEAPAIFKPSGTVYIKNNNAAEACVFEVIIIGRT